MMMSRKTAIALAAGLACGGTAFGLLYWRASELERRSRTVPVLVARRYIPPNSGLRPGDVQVRKIPEGYVDPGAVSDPAQLEGLASLVPLSAGEQVLANKFGRAGRSLSDGLMPGQRAYCLEVSESSGVGGLIRPGDRVDVLARYETSARRMTSFVLQNVLVLAAGRTTGRAQDDGGRESDGYSHVTLCVRPAEAETLAFLEEHAALKLLLRANGDEDLLSLPAIGEAEVFARLGRPPQGPKAVEIIRGPSSPPKGDIE